MKTLTLPAKIENIDTVVDFINAELEQADCSVKVITQLDIVIDEIFGNIAKYAYPDKEGDAIVQIYCGEDIEITFIDSGIPFNPLEHEDPDITGSAEERDIGGLGVFISKKLTDSAVYTYENHQNRLTIHKNY